MRPLYIFDLDGTLALNGHRQHLVTGAVKDWDKFSDMCHLDDPAYPVIHTFQRLQAGGADCVIWTGRSRRVAQETAYWLGQHGIYPDGPILMRAEDDHQHDTDLKKYWFGLLNEHDAKRLVAVFEDRTRMIEMWRGLGVAAFQVAKGDF